MSVNNLNNHHLTEPEINAILNALNDLERAMELLNINLTPEDRNKYGRVDEQNKLFINKVHDFATQQTNLRTMDVDWDEFEKDFKSRAVLENIISRLNNLSIRANNSKIFHEFEDKYNELRQFFAKSKRKQDKNQ